MATDCNVGVIWQTINKTGHLSELVGVVDRAKQNVFALWLTGKSVLANLRNQKFNELIVHRLVHQQSCCSGAVLTRVEETGKSQNLGGSLQIGVCKNHYRCLATKFKVHAL